MSNPLNVLLIEDNPDDVLLMHEMLKDTGIECNMVVLEDGEEAIHYLQRIDKLASNKRPNLVVLDLNLPKKNGHEVLDEIRKCANLLDLSVVVLSTSEDPEDRRKAAERNAAYVVKPARFDNLCQFIDAAEYTFAQKAEANELFEGNLEEQRPTDLQVPKQTFRVLLVEDNPDDVLLIETFLQDSRSARCDTHSVETMSAAVFYLARHHVDVIFADLGLPDAHGLNVLTRLQVSSRETPIIILTGLDDEEIAIEAVSQGAQDYLVKGQVDADMLNRAMRYAIKRKRAEELALLTVSAEKEVLQEILQHAPISIVRFSPELKILECNSVFAEQVQLPYESIVGSSITQIVPIPDPEQWSAMIKTGRPFRIEKNVVHENSSEPKLVWDLTVWPIKNRLGDTRGGIVLALDITDRTKLEQQREDFIASVAHDIKNPLVGADRILSVLTNPGIDVKEHDKLVALLKDSNSSVLTMLHNLLDIYRYEASAVSLLFQPVDIREPIDAALSMTSVVALNKAIKIELELPDSLHAVKADSVALQRLFSNLLLNAFQSSKPGTVVKIIGHNEPDALVMEVVDAGKGMTDEELSFIFKRFGESRVSKYRGGTGSGLGLYLCKQIVDAHGGSIHCDSEVEVGSKFTVRLPFLLSEAALPPVISSNFN